MRHIKVLVVLIGLGLVWSLGACSDDESSDSTPTSQLPSCTVSTCAKAEEACAVIPTLCSKDAADAKANPEKYKAECVSLITQIAEKTHEANPKQDPDTMMAKFTDCVKNATTCFVATNCTSNLESASCTEECEGEKEGD